MKCETDRRAIRCGKRGAELPRESVPWKWKNKGNHRQAAQGLRRSSKLAPQGCLHHRTANAAVPVEISGRIQKQGGLPDGTCEINTIQHVLLAQCAAAICSLIGMKMRTSFGILGPDSPELFAVGGEIFGGADQPAVSPRYADEYQAARQWHILS